MWDEQNEQYEKTAQSPKYTQNLPSCSFKHGQKYTGAQARGQYFSP